MKSNRITQIKQILLREGRVTNTDLCERFGISMATVRRELCVPHLRRSRACPDG